LNARFGGDDEALAPLAEDEIARLVERARAGDTDARQTLYVQYRVFAWLDARKTPLAAEWLGLSGSRRCPR
jgi:hypothetical protein